MTTFNRNYAMEKAVPVLLTGGFMVHLENLGHYLQFGHTDIKDVLLPSVDVVLATWMAYCAFGLIFGYRRFFQRFGITAGWRRRVYWLITFYVTASLPGHINFLVFGDTRYFDIFPWWFSPIIMAVYVLMSTYFVTLKESRGSVGAVSTLRSATTPSTGLLRHSEEVAS